MVKDYTHPNLNEEVTAVAGRYVHEKEDTVTFDGKEILYIRGYAVVDTSCCGMSGGRFAIVPGYIVKYRYRTDEAERFVSLVEPVEEAQDTRREIIRKIEERETYCNVRFLA